MKTISQWLAVVAGGTIERVTAKEKLLERAPGWTEAQAEAALRVVEAQIELADHLDEEAKLSAAEIEARENRWAEASAREAIREERHVAADLVSGLVEQQEGEQPGHPAIAVLERMDHQEVEDIGAGEQQAVMRTGAPDGVEAPV